MEGLPIPQTDPELLEELYGELDKARDKVIFLEATIREVEMRKNERLEIHE